MKVKEAISEAGMMIPDHNISEDLLYIWLSRVEGLIMREIKREMSVNISYTSKDADTSLAVPDPYSGIYPLYLQTMIYLYLGEYDRYNHLNLAYASAWSDYARYYIRNNSK